MKEAGASEDKSRAAARAIANYEKRFAGIEEEITDFRAEARSTFRLHNWMLATLIALNIAILFRVFS
jgi:hypothetical protein